MAAAMTPPVTLPVEDLWDWLSGENAIFAHIDTLFEPPGARLLPDRANWAYSLAEVLAPTPSAPEHLELLLVDQTFGTEELASYSSHIQQVEEPPRLLMHPGEAGKLGLSPGDQVALRLPRGELRVKLQMADNLAPGVLVLPRHRQLNWRLGPDYQLVVPHRDIIKGEE